MKHLGELVTRIGLTVVCAALLGCGAPADESGIPTGPHPMVVIAIDGLRADALGSYGGSMAPTPNFDALAAESVRFEWAFAQASDPAVSYASLVSGLYPTTSGVREPGDILPEEAATLAEQLSTADLLTYGALEGPEGGNAFGLGQGFVHFHVRPQPGEHAIQWLEQHAEDDFLLMMRGWTAGWDFGPDTRSQSADAPEGFFDRLQQVLLSDRSEQPLPIEPQDLEFARTLYTDRVAAVDGALGEFMELFRTTGLADRATLILLGTSGLDLEQHGATGSISLHSTLTRVPLFIRFPGGAAAGTVDRIVELIDLMPTLIELAGGEVPTAVQGRSLLPLIKGAGKPPYLAMSETTALGGQRAIALGGYRLVFSSEDDTAMFFNLAADPFELDDISATEGERVEVMRRHLDDFGKMVAVSSLDPELRTEEELDEETLERLRSWGYIQESQQVISDQLSVPAAHPGSCGHRVSD
jgi:arylsulfatase A-like enzyme